MAMTPMNQLKAHANFREEVVALVTKHLKKELTAGKSSIKARGVEGKLEDGIRTKMTLGDVNVLGEPSDTPVPGNVEDDKRHYFTDERLKNTPLSLLLPI